MERQALSIQALQETKNTVESLLSDCGEELSRLRSTEVKSDIIPLPTLTRSI